MLLIFKSSCEALENKVHFFFFVLDKSGFEESQNTGSQPPLLTNTTTSSQAKRSCYCCHLQTHFQQTFSLCWHCFIKNVKKSHTQNKALGGGRGATPLSFKPGEYDQCQKLTRNLFWKKEEKSSPFSLGLSNKNQPQRPRDRPCILFSLLVNIIYLQA